MDKSKEHSGLLNGEPEPSSKQSPKADSFLRAANSGNLEKVLDFIKNGIDVNTKNSKGLNALHLSAKENHINIVTELINHDIDINAATDKGNTALHVAALAGRDEIVQILIQNNARINVQSQGGFTPLYMAAQENKIEVVKFLLDSGASQTLTTDTGFTPLSIAVQQKHQKVVELLLQHDDKKVRLPALHVAAKKDDENSAELLLKKDIDPNFSIRNGFSALHVAAHHDSLRVARILIEYGANVNLSAKNKITPLHIASKWNKPNMVKFLLEHGANISANTRDKLTALHCAARSGNTASVEVLLDNRAPVDSNSRSQLTPLHMAAQGNHYDTGRLLIHFSANREAVTIDYLTPLHVAAHCDSYDVAKLLLECNCEIDSRARNGFTPLHVACKKNRPRIIELLLRFGSKIDSTTETGLTPLHVASWSGHLSIVEYLIKTAKANPNAKSNHGETPLHMAVRSSEIETAKLLMKLGSDPNAQAKHDETPLHFAAKLGNAEMVECLLKNKANVNAITDDKCTSLHIAAMEGHVEVVKLLLKHKANVDDKNKYESTALHLASKRGHTEVVKILLKKGANVNAEGKHLLTPLHMAVHYGHGDVARVLLDNSASPNKQAKNGMTPLHIAAKKNQPALAKILFEYKANPNATAKNGYTPLFYVPLTGEGDYKDGDKEREISKATEMATLLLNNGADVNFAANNGLRPMHLCAQENHVPVAEVLVKYKSEIDPQTKAGYTPLHTACHFGKIDMILFLLNHRANIHATTKIGYTPLHQAAQQGHVLVVNYLLKYNADPNIISENGHTPLSIAQKLGYISVIESLKKQTTIEATPQEQVYVLKFPEKLDDDAEDSDWSDEDSTHGMDKLEISYMADPSGHDVISPTQGFSNNSRSSSFYQDESFFASGRIDCRQYDSIFATPTMDHSFSIQDSMYEMAPNISGFLISFMVNASGGAMNGSRHSGVRIIIPPKRACEPIKVICKLVKTERLHSPPTLTENEGLATRILEMSPAGYQFSGDVIIEVPHFASLRDGEREIVILRSDDGEIWKEHGVDCTADVLVNLLEGIDVEPAEKIYKRRVARIVTTNFPKYFALVSRVKQNSKLIGPKSDSIVSTTNSNISVVFPEGALTKQTKLGLQVYNVPEDTIKNVCKLVEFTTSPVVTLEPRRRKFHKDLHFTLPLPNGYNKKEHNCLRLLCSISGGNQTSTWEDVTAATKSFKVEKNRVTFDSQVSARYWLINFSDRNSVVGSASELYKEIILVPYMVNYVLYAKRIDDNAAQIRAFCVTDDGYKKTLETQENFVEIVRSKEIEAYEGKCQLEFIGNMYPVTKPNHRLALNFKTFQQNRLPFKIRVKDPSQPPKMTVGFLESINPQNVICRLPFELPGFDAMQSNALNTSNLSNLDSYTINGEELKLKSIADRLDSDWIGLAVYLKENDDKLNNIKSSYDYATEQALAFLHSWLESHTGNVEDLRDGLICIGRRDIVDDFFSTPPPILSNNYADEQDTPVEEDPVKIDVNGLKLENKPSTKGNQEEQEQAFEILATLMSDVDLPDDLNGLESKLSEVKEPMIMSMDDRLSFSSNEDLGKDGDPITEELESVKHAAPNESINDNRLNDDTDKVRVYTKTYKSEPQFETNDEEFVETLPDGSVVTHKIKKQTQKKQISKHIIMEGSDSGLMDDAYKNVGGDDWESKDNTHISTDIEYLPDGTTIERTRETTSSISSSGVVGDYLIKDNYDDNEDMDTGRVILRKDVIKQIKDGETIISEDVNVIQENEPPEGYKDSINNVISEFSASDRN